MRIARDKGERKRKGLITCGSSYCAFDTPFENEKTDRKSSFFASTICFSRSRNTANDEKKHHKE
jgi:hypothetical protein